MHNVNLLNQAGLENALESVGCLDIVEALIEKMQEYVLYHTETAERFAIDFFTVVNNYTKKVHAIFNVLENEDGETNVKNVEFEVMHFTE